MSICGCKCATVQFITRIYYTCITTFYLRQEGYVIVVVCMFVSNFAQKNFQTDLHEILKEGWQWADEQTIKFWWRSGSGILIGIPCLGGGMLCPSASSSY